jgi:hypothetical protein
LCTRSPRTSVNAQARRSRSPASCASALTWPVYRLLRTRLARP